MTRIAAILMLPLMLASCGSPLSFLTGGGPKVAANVPIGRTNVQGLGQTNVSETRTTFDASDAASVVQTSDTNQIRTNRVEAIHNDNRSGPEWWVILLLVAGWLVDSPLRWPGQIAWAFRRKQPA